MKITSPILNYALNAEGGFHIEEHEGCYYIYFFDAETDPDNSLKVFEDDGEVKIYTTSSHDFNDGLGFLSNLCSTRDKECANLICEALNNLREIYRKRKDS